MADSFHNGRVTLALGDLTTQRVAAVVNAANWTLLGGGGVDGAIHQSGGPQILADCEALRRTQYPTGLPMGQAAITSGGKLPAPYVIHTVGPIYGRHQGHEAELLAACYRNSLRLAVTHQLPTIAFPAISTGAYGYPRAEAAKIVSATLSAFLAHDSTMEEVRLVFFLPRDLQTFRKHQIFAIH